MSRMVFDEEGLIEEPCLSCDKCYIDNLFHEWCCDEEDCPEEKKKNNPRAKGVNDVKYRTTH